MVSPLTTLRPAATVQPVVTATPSARPTAERLAPTGPTEEADVVRIIDGDTIEVDLDGDRYRVRYVGINAPEWNAGIDHLARAATEANRDLVRDERVTLEQDVSDTDRFGRLLRHVWLDTPQGWVLVNLELVRAGFAYANTYRPDVSRDDLYAAAESEARAAGRGVWAAPP